MRLGIHQFHYRYLSHLEHQKFRRLVCTRLARPWPQTSLACVEFFFSPFFTGIHLLVVLLTDFVNLQYLETDLTGERHPPTPENQGVCVWGCTQILTKLLGTRSHNLENVEFLGGCKIHHWHDSGQELFPRQSECRL
jgi:hypothetical protein